jgi:uncharacterized phage protein gp47/JayE
MAELTPTGLSVRTQAEILAEIEQDQKDNVSSELDLSTSSPNGQINRLTARSESLLEEALAALFAAIDPDSATGEGLFRLGALRGTIREGAQPSRTTANVNLNAGTYAIGSLSIYPFGRPEDVFRNPAAVIVVSPGDVDVVFQAVTPGPIQVAADTMVRVPSAGFNGINGNTVATPGRDLETEGQFRQRSNEEIERPGSASTDGIVADLLAEIPEIVTCFATENDTDATVDSIPPHAVEVVVYGPSPSTDDDDDKVAAQILASKAGGIGTYGTTSRTVFDGQGLPKVIRFTRPVDVPITVVIGVAVDPNRFSGVSEVQNTIEAKALDYQSPGVDAAWSVVASWALAVLGVHRVTSITLNGTPFADVSISTRQRATFAAADVVVNPTPSSP